MSDRENPIENQIEKCLKNIFKQNLDHISLNVTGCTEKGDNYLGDIAFATLSGIGQHDQIENYSIVIKTGKTSKTLRRAIPVRESFENEMFVYDKIFPAFVEFQKEKNVPEPFDNFPKTYGQLLTDDYEVLVLENLRDNQFYLWDRTKPMDFEHLLCVARAYGKLHAFSFAMRDQKPDVFGKLSNGLCDVMKMFADICEPAKYSPFEDIIEELRHQGDLTSIKQIEKLQTDHTFAESISDRPYSVITHGDCWNNNFMFKNVGKLQVRIIDWQLSRTTSPIFDLSYFIFACISPDDLNNLDKIMHEYYASFSDFLMHLGSNPNSLFPFPTFLEQWKKHARFGIYSMTTVLRLSLSTSEEAPRFDEYTDKGSLFTEALKIKIGKVDEYLARTCGILRYAVEKELI